MAWLLQSKATHMLVSFSSMVCSSCLATELVARWTLSCREGGGGLTGVWLEERKALTLSATLEVMLPCLTNTYSTVDTLRRV